MGSVAAFILGLSMTVVAFLIGWLILMIIVTRIAKALPATSVGIKTVLMGVVAVSLGAAFAMGGGPIVEFVTGGPAQLTVHNNCPDPLLVIGDEVPANDSRTLSVPAVNFTVEQLDGEICVRSGFGLKSCFNVRENTEIIFDGQKISSGESTSINLGAQGEHELIITCE